ncbi:MAG TPA: hypothetical protein VES93_05685 [Ornithinibacter sp.]|nr:hypothetical protein [Ornithinibacter sp.]
MRAARLGLGLLGLTATAYGLLLVVGLGLGQLRSVLVWVVGGVVVHDAVLAPLVVALGVLAVLRTSPSWRIPLVWALLVLGPLTLVAVPVLGRFGARADNPTLLDRPYWGGYVVVATVVLVLTVAAALRRRRSAGG